MQRCLQPGHIGVTGICRHFAARPVLACQAGIVEAVVGLCAQRLDHCQGRDAQAQGSVNRPVHPAGIRIHHALRGHAHALLIETMRGGIEILNRQQRSLWPFSGRAVACFSPSLLAFSTVGAKSCGLARSGSAGFEGWPHGCSRRLRADALDLLSQVQPVRLVWSAAARLPRGGIL